MKKFNLDMFARGNRVKTALVLLIISLLLVTPFNKAYAQGAPLPGDDPIPCFTDSPDDLYEWTIGLVGGVIGCVWEAGARILPDIDIRRTVQDMFTSLLLDIPTGATVGLSQEELNACALLALDGQLGGPQICAMPPGVNDLLADFDSSVCSTLTANPAAAAAGLEPLGPLGRSPSSGSLAGIATGATYALYHEPVPVSLAFYARDVASNTMFLKDTAFAQEIDTSGDSFVGFPFVLRLWKLTRNLAFGLMAVFMLIVGMMIMMRKQIDPRTSVTIQYAIPRIIVSLALIAFSYAIGALAVGLIKPLTSVAWEPYRAVQAGLSPLLQGIIMINGLLSAVSASGIGLVGLLLGVLAFIVYIILQLILIIKGLVAYAKILILVIAAPIQFAWGAIPGNESSIATWFKHLAVNVLTIPIVTFGLAFGLAFAWSSFEEGFCGPTGYTIASTSTPLNPVGIIGGSAVNAILSLTTPIIVMAIFVWAAGLPKKLEDAVLGEKKFKK